MNAENFSPLRYVGDAVEILDQTQLPRTETWLHCDDVEKVAGAIERLSVRGAPAIGVAAAWGLVVGLTSTEGNLSDRFETAWKRLARTRPTAVNLAWALDRGRTVFEAKREQGERAMIDALSAWAEQLQRDDVATNIALARHGAELFGPEDRVLTHCNTGALATAGHGTALGVITTAWQQGRVSSVWVDETRPLLQGARLTTWELDRLEIPYRLIPDSSAGALMASGRVDRIVVGADRIAANGDAANKIGTYTVAVLAHRHNIPFYVAAPLSTVDPMAASGADIPIEERSEDEVRQVFGTAVAPADAPALNLAFDVTPHELIAGIITEAGVLRAPYRESLAAALAGAT
ncbi:MAG: S-methyl-5-thioribose-1-phosphate isomerase [Thermoanaerobaculia bacterium]|nr:S-methyl-5-thioribose-1-phosphate isomerase [Thermoanaerobaculia bacterium]